MTKDNGGGGSGGEAIIRIELKNKMGQFPFSLSVQVSESNRTKD